MVVPHTIGGVNQEGIIECDTTPTRFARRTPLAQGAHEMFRVHFLSETFPHVPYQLGHLLRPIRLRPPSPPVFNEEVVLLGGDFGFEAVQCLCRENVHQTHAHHRPVTSQNPFSLLPQMQCHAFNQQQTCLYIVHCLWIHSIPLHFHHPAILIEIRHCVMEAPKEASLKGVKTADIVARTDVSARDNKFDAKAYPLHCVPVLVINGDVCQRYHSPLQFPHYVIMGIRAFLVLCA